MKNEFTGKLRPHTQEMPKHAAKVFINHTALAESGISPGKLCYVESTNGHGRSHHAIAWPSLDKNVGRNVALLSRVLQGLTGFPVGDVIRVSDAGDCPTADTVLVRETSSDGKPLRPEEQADMSAEERAHWEYAIGGRLSESSMVKTSQSNLLTTHHQLFLNMSLPACHCRTSGYMRQDPSSSNQ